MATAPNPPSTASGSVTALQQFLAIAPTKYFSITGTIPANVSNGSAGEVTWNRPIPVTPAICTAIDYEVTLPVELTLEATTGAATVSPFAPYSAIANQLVLGGAPPWNMLEFTPWYLDGLTREVG
ncbi:MAG: hypothetical protein QXL94_02990, partial [Candidatus Parvarchaeum sp.]